MGQKDLLIGITEAGIMHTDPDEFDVDTRFRMVREAGVFDYYDTTPQAQDVPLYREMVQKHGLPLAAGSFYYFLGQDEPLLEWHLRLGRTFGTRVHNVQIISHDIEGRPVTDEQIADLYLRAAEWGAAAGVVPCFEAHVDMWSEHFGRVQRVAELVERQGATFTMTLDPSHVIFKVDNPEAQEAQGLRADVEAGTIELDPSRPGNVCQQWIDAGYVRHAHARPAVPNGPPNPWMHGLDGQPGRGIQYPFLQPEPGEWHSPWDEALLEPWKHVVRQLMRHHAADPSSEPATISTELIPFADYGGGARYSLFEHSVACAEWLRATWSSIVAEEQQPAAQPAVGGP